MKIRELFEDKSDYVAKTFADKLVSALMRDDSEDAKKLKKGFKGAMVAPGGEASPEAQAKMNELAAKVVEALMKVDPKFDDRLIAQKARLEQEVEAAGSNLTLKVAKEKELRKVSAKLSGPADKYLVWIARMYTTGQFKLEDISRIRGEIITFEKNLANIENKDLNSYKTLNALYDVTDKFSGQEEAEVKKDEPEAEKDVEWLIYTPNYKALIPKSEEASCKYGQGTRWCTAATGGYNHYKSYASRGDLVIIICKIDGKTRKFQFHFETHSFMDERDSKASKEDIKGLSKHPEHVKLLHMLIDKHLGPDEE